MDTADRLTFDAIKFAANGALRIVLIGAVMAAALSVRPVCGQNTAADDRRRQLNLGVVKVLPVKSGGISDDIGAAVVIGGKTENIYIVTAYHVIRGATSIAVEPFGSRGSRFTATVFDDRYDPDSDIAVLVANKYQVREFLEQLYETDPASLTPGERVLLLGHPSHGDWYLKEAKVKQLTGNRIFVSEGAVAPRFSGGPLLNTYGDLLGIVTGIAPDGRGEVVRIDLVLDILDRWGVPYETKLRVDFCSLINRIVDESLNDFDVWKGAHRRPNEDTTIWTLNDRRLDITGTGQSVLVRSWYVGGTYDTSDNPTVYLADFGAQMDRNDCLDLQTKIVERIINCLPKKESFRREGRHCKVVSFRRHWLKTPISFVVNATNGNEVELYMYREYEVPDNPCNIGRNFILDHWWPSNW